MDFRKRVKEGKGLPYALLRRLHAMSRGIEVPVPKMIARILWAATRSITNAYYWGKSTFWVTPLYKGLCQDVGQGFCAGSFVPFVAGSGVIRIGNHVRLHGKQNFLFAAIRDDRPEIVVGDNTSIGHNVLFDIAGRLTIGNGCMIASNVLIQDCSGHPLDAARRSAGERPGPDDVKDVVIGENVWIGTGAYILPGAEIGDNSVIAANTVVSRRIPTNSLVYSQHPKVLEIRDLSKMK